MQDFCTRLNEKILKTRLRLNYSKSPKHKITGIPLLLFLFTVSFPSSLFQHLTDRHSRGNGNRKEKTRGKAEETRINVSPCLPAAKQQLTIERRSKFLSWTKHGQNIVQRQNIGQDTASSRANIFAMCATAIPSQWKSTSLISLFDGHCGRGTKNPADRKQAHLDAVGYPFQRFIIRPCVQTRSRTRRWSDTRTW